MPKVSETQHRMETRAGNKQAHPGITDKGKTRRTTAEVQQEREAKAQAKEAKKAERQRFIKRTAEFEHDEMANEDVVDATPRPPFTPMQRRASQNHQNSLSPVTEMSDVDAHDQVDASLFVGQADCSDMSVIEEDIAAESDAPPPVQKRAANAKTKTTGKAAGEHVRAVAASKRKKEAENVEDVVPDSEGEAPEEPKPKKVKVKVRDEINTLVKGIEENEIRKTYGNMLKSTFTIQTGKESRGGPASKAPSQVQLVGRPLKREGAIADINALYQRDARTNPDESSKRSQQNAVMMVDKNRYDS